METRHHLHQPLGAEDALRKRVESRLDTDHRNDQQGIEMQLVADGLGRRKDGLQRLGRYVIATGNIIQRATHAGIERHGARIVLRIAGLFIGNRRLGIRQERLEPLDQIKTATLHAEQTHDEDKADNHQELLEKIDGCIRNALHCRR
jgi:hypothetical protein